MTAADVFSENVKLFRTKLKMSQDELAEKSGLSRTTISFIETKKYDDINVMEVGTIRKLADALGVSCGELLGEDTYEVIKMTAVKSVADALKVDVKKIFA